MENFVNLDNYVQQCIPFTEEEMMYFHQLFFYKKFKKNSFLLEETQVCNFEAFILKGCIKTFFLDINAQETIVAFATENWWVSDLESFTNQTPATLNIQALEDCDVLMITHENKELLFRQIPKFERVFRLMVQRSLFTMMNRFHASVSKTAEQRYQDFMQKYPYILQRVPQNQIARYIGVSPEFLSKVRNGWTKK